MPAFKVTPEPSPLANSVLTMIGLEMEREPFLVTIPSVIPDHEARSPGNHSIAESALSEIFDMVIDTKSPDGRATRFRIIESFELQGDETYRVALSKDFIDWSARNDFLANLQLGLGSKFLSAPMHKRI